MQLFKHTSSHAFHFTPNLVFFLGVVFAICISTLLLNTMAFSQNVIVYQNMISLLLRLVNRVVVWKFDAIVFVTFTVVQDNVGLYRHCTLRRPICGKYFIYAHN